MKQITIIAVAAACLAASAGCSLIKPRNNGTVDGSTATLVVYPSTVAPATDTPSATTSPADANPGRPTPQASHQASAGEQSALAANLAGEWSIIRAGDIVIDRDEDMPYITFEPDEGRFYASNGCNTINGSYKVNSKDDIEFFGVLSTMRYCGDVPYELAINSVIADNHPSRLTVTTVSAETFIDFTDASGKSVMRIRRGDQAFLNGNWKVVSINGLDKLEVPADVFFDLGELTLHGNTGCNYFNGKIYLDHRRSNAVDFSNMGTTRMACPYTAQETAMLVALEQSATAVRRGDDLVVLLDSEGRELMTLSRLPLGSTAD